jgi:uncharacterized membrane protein YedE/YeeE
MRYLTSALSGAFFAFGLIFSGMIEPSKVVGFLDVAGAWDPTLAFVMGGALAVVVPAYRMILRRNAPVVADTFDVPKRNDITWQLILGAAVFGVGWGVTGLCPAAAIAALPALSPNAVTVTLGMAIGIVGMRALRRVLKPSGAELAPSADF